MRACTCLRLVNLRYDPSHQFILKNYVLLVIRLHLKKIIVLLICGT
jgi:hypothetical protein